MDMAKPPPAAAENGNAQVCQPRVVFVLGGRGRGDVPLCAKIVDSYGFTHLFVGGDPHAEGSQYVTMYKNTKDGGVTVKSEATVKLLQKVMQESGNDKFVIDGFPTNEENRCAFEALTGIEPEFVVIFEGKTEGHMKQRGVDDSQLPVVRHYEQRGKVHKVYPDRDLEDVFKSLRPLFVPFMEEDLLHLTKELLRSIDSGNGETYINLSDPALTGFEPVAKGHLVQGMEFHKYYFVVKDQFPSAYTHSELSSPKILLLTDDVAIVAYTRLRMTTTVDGKVPIEAFNETRVWQRKEDTTTGLTVWKHVHLHRSFA